MPSLSDETCDPTYGKVDDVLELITKSKSLHILTVLDRSEHPLRFTAIKSGVNASSTTISRRLKELGTAGLVVQTRKPQSPQSYLYVLSEHGKRLSPIMQSLFDWAVQWPYES